MVGGLPDEPNERAYNCKRQGDSQPQTFTLQECCSHELMECSVLHQSRVYTSKECSLVSGFGCSATVRCRKGGRGPPWRPRSTTREARQPCFALFHFVRASKAPEDWRSPRRFA